MTEYVQSDPYNSPWSFKLKIKILAWEIVWAFFCAWTPKPANKWRLLFLKIFGAKIFGTPFVHQRARIQFPWNLILHDRACLGDRANAYSLDIIEIHENATVAQEVYLCTGTHAFEKSSKNLITSPIIIEKDAFIGARSFIMPGVRIGYNSIVGSCSVVTKNVVENTTVKGNPAK